MLVACAQPLEITFAHTDGMVVTAAAGVWRDVPMALVGVRPSARCHAPPRSYPSFAGLYDARSTPPRRSRECRVRGVSGPRRISRRRRACGRPTALVREWLTSRSQPYTIARVSAVATVFVENVVYHTLVRRRCIWRATEGPSRLAGEDAGSAPAQLRESDTARRRASGLAAVDAHIGR